MAIKQRILLVEDEDHLLEAIKLNLEMEGYKVSTATDGKKALKILIQWMSENLTSKNN